MNVLVDTNVLLSAALRDRLPAQVVRLLASQDAWRWLVTEEILREYVGVLRGRNLGFRSIHSASGLIWLRCEPLSFLRRSWKFPCRGIGRTPFSGRGDVGKRRLFDHRRSRSVATSRFHHDADRIGGRVCGRVRHHVSHPTKCRSIPRRIAHQRDPFAIGRPAGDVHRPLPAIHVSDHLRRSGRVGHQPQIDLFVERMVFRRDVVAER
jgi:hypothetical protein